MTISNASATATLPSGQFVLLLRMKKVIDYFPDPEAALAEALRRDSDETKALAEAIEALAELVRKQQREVLATGQLMMLPTSKLTRH
jgi:hypothetical protein